VLGPFEIWVGTQNPSGLHNDVARLLETDRSRITFDQHLCNRRGYFGSGLRNYHFWCQSAKLRI
jgi:hypothetical protein